ncbi:MAG TPA: bifunctional glutamate N-acetyltransferase/amino-acid acetyltransferase ArgJ, partial [Actinomycetota bacterium]|nr:bifunctional glutamate N-acetyltransferase/amino-acid acetyltransferase ArgJ [Actinomycetota bacterium]
MTFPAGFRAAGVSAGVKPSGAADLGLLVGAPGTTVAGLFTTNLVVAAPVTLTRGRIAAGRGTAVVVNSGQANAATGARGEADAVRIVEGASAVAGVASEDMLACSTGVIGEPVHLREVMDALPSLGATLGLEGGPAFADAIMTTDTVAKAAETASGPHRVGGAAKGVGMISPNLATMLAFVTTDAAVAPGDLAALAHERLKPWFAALTVDGCTSTNDTVLLFASGAAGEGPVGPGDRAWSALADAIDDVGAALASQLIRDAEGVTTVTLVEVEGASSEGDARTIAKAVADSPLVKTAVFGSDPNPGRILQAVGSSGVEVSPSLIDVWVGDTPVARGGVIPPAYFEP